MRTAILAFLLVLVCIAGSPDADAVIISSGDGTGNTTGPPFVAAWDHVGQYGNNSAVYVGNGWILTARHVSVAEIQLDGVTYRTVAGSRVQVDPPSNPDLAMLRIESDPGLADLSISHAAPTGDVLLIGGGLNRGAAVNWDPDPFDDGWAWGSGKTLRWGTNEVAAANLPIDSGYQSIAFVMDFTESGGTPDESIAANGDSGGGVFIDDGSSELAGIMVGVAGYAGQPAATALFGNATYAVQLSAYESEILAIRAENSCDNGIDDDGDGDVDYPDDIGCQSANDAFERLDSLPCDDGFDADGDGAVDYPEDVGCPSPSGTVEDPACSDGIDNDGDGQIDWDGGAWVHGVAIGPIDTFCSGPSGLREKPKSCGLGFELALALPLLSGLRRRLRRRS